MRAKVTKIDEKPSYRGGSFFFIFFKTDEGRSAKTCIYPQYGNARRWLPEIPKWRAALADGREVWLDGLFLRGNLIDADSQFTVKVLSNVAA